MTSAEQADPTAPRADEQWPSDPPLTAQQDHAVLSWLVVEVELPDSVQGHLAAALTAWEPIMGPHLIPVEPLAGPDCDLADLLDGQWWRRSEQADAAGWQNRVALVQARDDAVHQVLNRMARSGRLPVCLGPDSARGPPRTARREQRRSDAPGGSPHGGA